MTEVSAFTRYRILLGLRFRLLFRMQGKSRSRAIAHAVVFVLFLGLAALVFFMARSVGAEFASDPSSLVHLIFFGMLAFQLAFGAISFAASEFFDVSRLMHLPVGYREVFAAMVTSGVCAPMSFVYLAPGLGVTVALGGGLPLMLCRVGLLLLLNVLVHGVVLVANLLILTVMTRRKLRDTATLVASLAGVGLYLLLRSFELTNVSAFVRSDPTANLRFLPSAWLAELFLADMPLASLLPAALASFGLLLLVLFAGGRALKAAFLGIMPSPEASRLSEENTRRRDLLPGDLAAMVRTIRRLYLRDPHIKALYLQQTAFLLAPTILLQLDGKRRGLDPEFFVFMLPTMLALSHMAFVQSFFGLDGKGIVLTFLTPVPRWRILLARGLALGGMFLLLDSVVTFLCLLTAGFVRKEPLALLYQFPVTYVAVVIFTIVLLSLGTITSVLWPTRMATAGRRALGGQRMENQGCTTQVLRALIFFPAAALGSGLAFFAVAPVLKLDFISNFVPKSYVWVTVPLGLLIAVGIYAAVLGAMAQALERREERVLAALVDTGE